MNRRSKLLGAVKLFYDRRGRGETKKKVKGFGRRKLREELRKDFTVRIRALGEEIKDKIYRKRS